jgi:hypothetical protein
VAKLIDDELKAGENPAQICFVQLRVSKEIVVTLGSKNASEAHPKGVICRHLPGKKRIVKGSEIVVLIIPDVTLSSAVLAHSLRRTSFGYCNASAMVINSCCATVIPTSRLMILLRPPKRNLESKAIERGAKQRQEFRRPMPSCQDP